MAKEKEVMILQRGCKTTPRPSSSVEVADQRASTPRSGLDTEGTSPLRYRAEAGQLSKNEIGGGRLDRAQSACSVPHSVRSVLEEVPPLSRHGHAPKSCGRYWGLLGPCWPTTAIVLLTTWLLMEGKTGDGSSGSVGVPRALTGQAVSTMSATRAAEYMKRFDIPERNIDFVWRKSGGSTATLGGKTYHFQKRKTNVGVYAGYSSMYDSSSRRYCERSSAQIDTKETVGRPLMAAGACPNWGKVIAFTDSRGQSLDTKRWKTEIHGKTMPHSTTGCKNHASPGSSEVRKQDEGMSMYSGYMTSCPFNKYVYEEDMLPDDEYDRDICNFVTFANKLWFLDTSSPSGGRPYTPYAFHGNGGHPGYDYAGQTSHVGCPPYSPPRNTSGMKDRSWLTDPFQCSILSRCTSHCWPYADGGRCFRSLPVMFDLDTKECRILGYHTQFFQRSGCAGSPTSAEHSYYCLKPTKTVQTSSLVYLSAHTRPDYKTMCPPREPFLNAQWGVIGDSRYCNPIKEETTIENTTAEGCGVAVFENSSSDDDSLILGGMHWATFTSNDCPSMDRSCRATARGRCTLYTKAPQCFFEKLGTISFTSLTAVNPGLAREPDAVALLPANPCATVNCGEHGSCSEGKCVCDAGWKGANCETHDLCHGVVCQNGGSCDTTTGECVCQKGWGGENCDKRDLCHNVLCKNGGSCDATNGKCVCTECYGGLACNERKPRCCTQQADCGLNEECDTASKKCRCARCYEEKTCTRRTEDCCLADAECQTNATCNTATNKCVCRPNHATEDCHTVRPLCQSDSCSGAGQCDPNTGRCTCNTCSTGGRCETSIPGCCEKDSDCINQRTRCLVSSNKCVCSPGYGGENCETLEDELCVNWCTSDNVLKDSASCEGTDCIFFCCQSYYQCVGEGNEERCYEDVMRTSGAECCLPKHETNHVVVVAAAAAGGVGLLLLLAGGAVIVLRRKGNRRQSVGDPSVDFDTDESKEKDSQDEESIEVSLEDFKSHPDDNVDIARSRRARGRRKKQQLSTLKLQSCVVLQLVKMEQLAEFLRDRGYSPSKRELHEFWSRTEGHWTPGELQEFCGILSRRKDSAEDFIAFCKVYDREGTGRVTKQQLRSLLQAVGEPLTDREWMGLEVLCKWHQTDQEFVDYAELASCLLIGSCVEGICSHPK